MPSEDGVLRAGALHFLGGLQFGSEKLVEQLLRRDDEYVFFDRAYLKGGRNTNLLRCVHSAYQNHKIVQSQGPRDFGVKLSPWRKHGNCIMLCPPGAAIRQAFGLGDWQNDMTLRLMSLTSRVIDISLKGDRRPLGERLANCHAVVTWTSNVAVEAAAAGVPVFVSPFSAAAPVGTLLDDMTKENVESPRMPDDGVRQAWLDGLAWSQFSLDEIKSGFADRSIFGERKIAEAA